MCISSYDAIVRLPRAERIYDKGALPLEYEERFVLHAECGVSPSAAGLPSTLKIRKEFSSPTLESVEAASVSIGDIAYEIVNSETKSFLEINLSFEEHQLDNSRGVKVSLRWITSRNVMWELDFSTDKSTHSWTDVLFLAHVDQQFQEDSANYWDMYSHTALSVTFVVPRTIPRIEASLNGHVMARDKEDTMWKWLATLHEAGDHGYGAWDINTREWKLDLNGDVSKDKVAELDGKSPAGKLAFNNTIILTKSKFVSNMAVDLPFVCEEALQNRVYVAAWHWLLVYIGFMLVSRLVFGLESVLQQTPGNMYKLLLIALRCIFYISIITLWIYLYNDIRTPICITLYAEAGYSYVQLFFWTGLPALMLVLMAWPIYLNIKVSRDIDSVLEPLIALHKGEAQKARGQAKLSAIVMNALTIPMYAGLVIFLFRVYVTDRNVLTLKLQLIFHLIVATLLWASRMAWHVDLSIITKKILLITLILPTILVVLWYRTFILF